MVDTIIANIENPDIRGILDNLKNSKTINNGVYDTIKGHYKNFKVSIDCSSGNHLISLAGSLHKFSKGGQNISTLTFQDIKDSLEQIEDELRVPFLNADLNRVDIGANFIMETHPSVYLMQLDHLDKHKKSTWRDYESLYFTAYNRELTFYDKLREFKPKNLIPNNYRKTNLLRYEYKFLRSINEQLDTKSLKVKDLRSKKLQRRLVGVWEGSYMSIRKKSVYKFSTKPSIPNIKNFLIPCGINHMGGLNKTRLLLNKEMSRYNRNPVQKNRVNTWLIKQVAGNKFKTKKYTRELSSLVRNQSKEWPY